MEADLDIRGNDTVERDGLCRQFWKNSYIYYPAW